MRIIVILNPALLLRLCIPTAASLACALGGKQFYACSTINQYIMKTSTEKGYALDLLHTMLGEAADFRPGQWEAIEAVAIQKKRALVVQRTGWGKSLVYFLATKLLREQGAGPILLISPLLSLMRNQIDMAARIGIHAHTIHSAETGGTWAGAIEALKTGWIPVFVLEHDQMPEGNKMLLQKGALAFPHPFKEAPIKLPDWLKANAASSWTQPSQPSLF